MQVSEIEIRDKKDNFINHAIITNNIINRNFLLSFKYKTQLFEFLYILSRKLLIFLI